MTIIFSKEKEMNSDEDVEMTTLDANNELTNEANKNSEKLLNGKYCNFLFKW